MDQPSRPADPGKLLILPVCLAMIGYAFLLAAWVMGNPSFEAPDERSNYIRAIAVGAGELTGTRVPITIPQSYDAKARAQTRWEGASTRTFSLDQRLISPVPSCNWTGSGPFRCTYRYVSGRRRVLSKVGTYPPLPYIVPGLTARLGSNSIQGLHYARAASAFITALFLLAALLAAADSLPAFAACNLAITPTLVFSGSIVSTSSIEIAGGLCFASTGFRLIRNRSTGIWWLPMGLSGAALALSRSASPLWLLLLAGLVLAVGPGLWRSSAARKALGLALVGFLAEVAWGATQEPHLRPVLSGFGVHLESSLRSLRYLLPEAVGNFGYVNVPLPGPEWAGWLLCLLVLVVAAAHAAGRRGRLALGAALACCFLVPVGFNTLLYAQTGFAPQARHFLPFWVALPVLAGHLLTSSPSPGRVVRPLTLGVAVVVSTVQFLAWYANSRYWLVGSSGSLFFFHPSGWTPPLGVVPWLCLAIGGALSLSFAHISAARREAA